MKKLFPLFLIALIVCWSSAFADRIPTMSSADVSYMPGENTSGITSEGGDIPILEAVTDGSADVAPFRSGSHLPVITDYHDSVYCFTLDTLVDTQFLGVEFDGTYFWITGGNTALDPNKLYKYDAAGNLISTYDQNSSAGWGWRDLAFDGTYLYGSDDTIIDQIDPATGLPTGVTITGPSNPCRALAYDPATDHFWTANFSSDIWEFSRDGTVNNIFGNTKSIYGMAWDDLSTDGPWLWVFSQDGTPGMEISQFDPDAGVYTGVSFQGSLPTGYTGGIAGGACFVNWGTNIEALFVLGQGTPTDFVYGYDMFPIGAILGACCVGDQCVATNTQAECDVLQGDWYIGEDCNTFQCPAPGPQCPPGSIFDQIPHDPTAVWSAATSDAGFQPENYAVFENFSVTGEICDIHWWGFSLEYNLGWYVCSGEAMAFDVIFYPDVGGMPDTLNPTCIYANATPIMTNTGILYSGTYPLWRFDLVLNPCCNLTSGWVMIQGVSTGSPDCRFLWISSPTGDGDSYQRSGGVMGLTGYDRALCLTGQYVPEFGACCDDFSGSCTDNVEIINCPSPLRFQANTLCADLQPPCGILGACCVNDQCVATNTQAECDVLQGDWYEGENCANFTCPQMPTTCDDPDVVYTNGDQVTYVSAYNVSQCDIAYPFQFATADDFILSGTDSVDITSVVTWTWHWNGNVNGPGDYDALNVVIYENDDVSYPGTNMPAGEPVDGDPDCAHIENLPNGIVYMATLTPGSFNFILEDPTEFLYRLEIPVSVRLAPNVKYWLEVQPEMQFGLAGQVATRNSTLQTGDYCMRFAPMFGYDPWTTQDDSVDMAFCLLSGAGGGGCDYVDGDVNGSSNFNGLDVTYGVNFFKYGSPAPQCSPDCPPCAGWHYCGDVNSSCNYNGLDITYSVNYFKYGSPGPVPCGDCPPNP